MEMRTLKTEMRIEHLIGKKVKATLGMAYGVGKTEREARLACEAQVVDCMGHYGNSPKMEIRQGYLIISQIESSESAWYLIKRIGGLQDGFLHPLCCMQPAGLKAAIESHLAQYIADEN